MMACRAVLEDDGRNLLIESDLGVHGRSREESKQAQARAERRDESLGAAGMTRPRHLKPVHLRLWQPGRFSLDFFHLRSRSP